MPTDRSWGVHCRVGREHGEEILPGVIGLIYVVHDECCMDACNCPCHGPRTKDDK